MVEPFKQDTEFTPVLFRMGRGKQGREDGPTAVFPAEPHDMAGYYMTCYAHIGQHSGCSRGWYNTTRAATPAEYADLKAELEGPPYGYRLKVYKRMQRTHREAFRKEVARLHNRGNG